MKSSITRIFFVFLTILLLESCSSKKVFTSAIKQSCGLNQEQLQQIQFYTSEEIVLRKTQEKSDAKIKSGKIIVSNKKDAETIVIPKHTPCVLVKDLGKIFLLSFEYGEGKLLAFGSYTGAQYTLYAEKWEGTTGTLEYADREYQTTGDACLLVNMKELKRVKKRYRVVHGRKL